MTIQARHSGTVDDDDDREPHRDGSGGDQSGPGQLLVSRPGLGRWPVVNRFVVGLAVLERIVGGIVPHGTVQLVVGPVHPNMTGRGARRCITLRLTSTAHHQDTSHQQTDEGYGPGDQSGPSDVAATAPRNPDGKVVTNLRFRGAIVPILPTSPLEGAPVI